MGSNSLMTMTHSINDVDLWKQPCYVFQGGQREGSLGDKERGPQASLSLTKDWLFLHKYKSFQAESESIVSSFVAANAEIPAWAWSLPCTSVSASGSGSLRIWWGDLDYLLQKSNMRLGMRRVLWTQPINHYYILTNYWMAGMWVRGYS